MLSRIIEGGLRITDREKLIRTSGLFDAEWYAARYPDVGGPERALAHFLKYSASKGTDPGPGFSTRGYLAENPDVAANGMNPLLHYLRFGRFEGRMARDQYGRPSGDGEDHGLNEAALARVRAAFDADFYRDTNPDLPNDIDAFAHFMGPGWRQRRDPADWFSVDHYLREHDDVAAGGQNPFSHYVLSGCREDRSIMASVKPRHTLPGNAGPLRTAVVAMVKNEADIIRVFAGHVLALFDEVVIVDHGSNDGTDSFLGQLADQNAQVTLLHLEEPSYIQSVTMTHVLRNLPVLSQVDWVFFLDADEFLPFPDRAEFHEALARFARCPVIAMHWRNLIPETYWSGPVSISDESTFLMPPAASPFRKIALQPARVPLHRAVVSQGNHSLTETANGLEIAAFEADFPLYHLPIRSADQLMLKLNQGVLAYQKMGKTRDAGQGTHWYQLKKATDHETLSPEHLNAMAKDYSEQKDRTVPVSCRDLINAGYHPQTFCPVQREFGLPDIDPRPLSEMLMRLYAQDFSTAATEDLPSATRLEIVEGHIRRIDDAAEYTALERLEQCAETPELSQVLKYVFEASYRPLDDLVASDWSAHAPVMLSLVGLLEPRRFVDLGTLHGSAFFAGVQATNVDCENVAIAPWADHDGVDGDKLFERFQFIARKYADRTCVLRMATDAALARFDDGSIDLLHCDGLSNYAEARETIDAWVPKLSDRGVLLIHDIHAHGNGQEVWRLWDDLSADFRTLDFRHDRGLGVVCVGANVPPALTKLSDAFRSDRHVRTLLQRHFEEMGALSAELFSRRFDMARAEMRAAAEGAQTEELSWMRQELATVRAEAEDLREMVKGGLRRVVE